MSYKTVGIPRALFYYYLFPLWETYFQELGFKVVLSSPTDKKIVNLGVQRAVDEVCYPVKIYYGHLASLLHQVDYIFLPRLVSIEKKSYICPKFMGLPDMIKAGFAQLPEVIEQTFDESRNPQGVQKSLEELGKKMGFGQKQVRYAIRKALLALSEYERKLQLGFSPKDSRPAVGLLGHGYNIYDAYASMNIIKKLEKLGVEVVTPEMLSTTAIEKAAGVLPKRMFWTLGRKIIGSGFHLAQEKAIAGIIHVASFGCGPDSMVAELMERSIRRREQKPFLNLTIDEHTGEAGLDTRLEAFIDMIARRKIS